MYYYKQDACTGVHSACRRDENGHNLDIYVPRRLWLGQGKMCGGGCLKVGGCLNLQIWDLNRAHETERTVFPILQVFSMCIDANYDIKESIKGIFNKQCNEHFMNTEHFYYFVFVLNTLLDKYIPRGRSANGTRGPMRGTPPIRHITHK